MQESLSGNHNTTTPNHSQQHHCSPPSSYFSSSTPKPSNPKLPQIPPNVPSQVYPDDNSPVYESIAQGLPPVQVAPSVEHLHEGHLGGVTKGWGSDLTNPPSPTNPSQLPPQPSPKKKQEMNRITSENKPTRKLTVLELAKKEENRLKINNKKQITQTSITKFINCQSPTQKF